MKKRNKPTRSSAKNRADRSVRKPNPAHAWIVYVAALEEYVARPTPLKRRALAMLFTAFAHDFDPPSAYDSAALLRRHLRWRFRL